MTDASPSGSDSSQADADTGEPDLGTEHYRDVPHLILFPLKQDVDYAYERSWHDCRPSETNCERAHRAVAIYAPLDTPVYAGIDGEIAFRGTDGTSGGGYQLHIDTTDGAEIRYVYAHLGPNEQGAESEAFAVNPRTGNLWDQGDEVLAGELLGFLGESGLDDSDPRLQVEVRSRIPGAPEEETQSDREYGDPEATPGSFRYLRFDAWDTLQLAESFDRYP